MNHKINKQIFKITIRQFKGQIYFFYVLNLLKTCHEANIDINLKMRQQVSNKQYYYFYFMGNCDSEFQNISQQNQQWISKNRNYGQLIGKKHLEFDPQYKYLEIQENEKTNTQHQHKLNPNIIHYDAMPSKPYQQQQSKLQSTNQLIINQQIKEAQQYDSTFYNSLNLPEYVYKKINDPQYKGTQYKPTEQRRGVKYLGQWKNNVPHGKGILISNTQNYIGWFCRSVKHQHGRQILTDQVYEGPFVFGKRKGKDGKLYKRDRTEEGQFDLVLINGEIHYHNDNSIYRGPLVNGIRQAQMAQFQWSDGAIYQGSFRDDKINGFGTIRFPDGRMYKGQFLDQKKHGHGTFQWKKDNDIQRYEGQYHNDLKHGTGKFWWSVQNNYYYQGSFQYGKPHGSGRVRDQNGQRIAQFCYGKQIK